MALLSPSREAFIAVAVECPAQTAAKTNDSTADFLQHPQREARSAQPPPELVKLSVLLANGPTHIAPFNALQMQSGR